MNENEPLLIDAAEKILNKSDVAALHIACWVESEVVVQSVAAIAQHRRPAQTACDSVPRDSNTLWQYFRGSRSSPDVRVSEVAQHHHCPLSLTLRGNRIERKRR